MKWIQNCNVVMLNMINPAEMVQKNLAQKTKKLTMTILKITSLECTHFYLSLPMKVFLLKKTVTL